MPPGIDSRYQSARAVYDVRRQLHLTDRELFLYRDFSDNRTHVVRDGENVFTTAGRYFAPLDRSAGYFWALCDFQPDGPIVDPTLRLATGTRLTVPSVAALESFLARGARHD